MSVESDPVRQRRSPRYGESGHKRRDHDFYPTPDWVTDILVDRYRPRGIVWEPASGDGAMVRRLTMRGIDVVASDIRGVASVDFLHARQIDGTFDSIVTNPPYGDLAEHFVRHALNLTEPLGGMVGMLLNFMWDAAASRRDLFNGHPAFAAKIAITRRIRWIAGTTGSPREHHAWFVWDWQRKAAPTGMQWWP